MALRPCMAEPQTGGVKRLALIIANANYPGAGPIESASKDADLLAVELVRDGFTIDRQMNATEKAMRGAVADYLSKIKPPSAAFIYFKGVGLQLDHKTYLIPVAATIESEADIKAKGISLDGLLDDVHQRGAVVEVAIVDAARHNPSEQVFRPGTDGLASVDAPPGSLVVYAQAPNKFEPEHTGNVSVFMTQMLKALRQPSVSAEEAATQTRIFVSRASNGEQVPYVASTLSDPIYFSRGAAPAQASTKAAQAPTAKPPSQDTAAPGPSGSAADDAESAYWKAVALNTVDAYQSVLDRFPNHPRREAILVAIRKIVAINDEEKVWSEASSKTGADALPPLRRYTSAYPYGVHADEARRRITQYESSSSASPPADGAHPAASGQSCVAGLQEAGPNNFLVLRYQPVLDPNGGWDPDIKLYNGQHLTVLSENGRFDRVRLPDGREGYASRDKIEPCTGEESAQTHASPGNGACAVAGLSDEPPDNWLALRDNPKRSAYYPQDIKLRNGTLLTVLGKKRDWVRVRIPSGEVGWVSARYTRC